MRSVDVEIDRDARLAASALVAAPVDVSRAADQSSVGRDTFAFIGVGGVSALSYVLAARWIFSFDLSLPNWLISSILYGLFVPLAYAAHRMVSFRSKTRHRVALPRYICVQIGAMMVAGVTSHLTHSVLQISAGGGSAIVIIASSVFSFLALRSWAFAEEALAHE